MYTQRYLIKFTKIFAVQLHSHMLSCCRARLTELELVEFNIYHSCIKSVLVTSLLSYSTG